MAFAGCICEPDRFAMSCGGVVPLDEYLIEEVTLDTLAWRRGDPERVAEDPPSQSTAPPSAAAS
jgi:hypothetical protein